MHNQPTPSTWTILGGGIAVLIGSFLNFYQIDFGNSTDGRSAWSGDLFFPVTIIPVLCGVVMALHVALTTFADTRLPHEVGGFRWNQLHMVLGLQAAVMMLAFLIQDKDGLDIGIGFWLMLLGSIALATGAILRQREGTSTPEPPAGS